LLVLREKLFSALHVLHTSKSAFYYILGKAIVYKKNIYIETVRTRLFFAVFLVLEFIAWIILPQPTAASTS
jgi:hypothetical protein